MTTKDTTSGEATLDLWRKCPYLTVDEAMNLILEVKPKLYRFDYEKESNMPSDAVPIYRALIKDIQEFKLCLYFNGTKATDESALNQLNVVSYDEFLYSCWWHQGKILTEDLKAWLRSKGYPSAFFAIKPANIPDYMNADLEEYSYKLAAAVKAWEHFYARRGDIKGRSLKGHIKAWLTEHADHLNLLKKDKKGKKLSEPNETAIEEIAKVVNWKPEGGAPES